MSFHIGKTIKKEIKTKGWSIKRFAEEANMTYRNALYLFDRTDISIDQLKQISKVLGFDFVGLYNNKDSTPVTPPEEPQTEAKKGGNIPTLTYSFGIPLEAYGNIKDFMEELNALANKHGLHIL
ncbi:MAG: helix-turn-helix transcriptional regulator [Sphingobacteriaceae bacterium]|nr:helix-turn-helix transcriptional regulator [Sphingobacteriaceae bacterium]